MLEPFWAMLGKSSMNKTIHFLSVCNNPMNDAGMMLGKSWINTTIHLWTLLNNAMNDGWMMLCKSWINYTLTDSMEWWNKRSLNDAMNCVGQIPNKYNYTLYWVILWIILKWWYERFLSYMRNIRNSS